MTKIDTQPKLYYPTQRKTQALDPTTGGSTMATETKVTFTEDIPKIVREGSGTRRSKYDDLLDAVRARAENAPDKPSVATLTLASQSEATSRYTSVKGAATKREDAERWTLAVRSQDDGSYALYIKYETPEPEAKPAESAPKPAPRRRKAATKAA